jgi:hypothetical protein
VFRSSKKYIPFSFGVGRALCPFPFPTGISGTEITKTKLAFGSYLIVGLIDHKLLNIMKSNLEYKFTQKMSYFNNI